MADCSTLSKPNVHFRIRQLQECLILESSIIRKGCSKFNVILQHWFSPFSFKRHVAEARRNFSSLSAPVWYMYSWRWILVSYYLFLLHVWRAKFDSYKLYMSMYFRSTMTEGQHECVCTLWQSNTGNWNSNNKIKYSSSC